MCNNDRIYVLTADLGYSMWDELRVKHSTRFYCFGASEFAMTAAACGMALSGKIPVLYNITPFLLLRPFEINKLYINDEKIPLKLVGAGRDMDYKECGITHCLPEAKSILSTTLPNIKQYWPETKDEITKEYLHEFIHNEIPSFISLRR
jgi:transketolase